MPGSIRKAEIRGRIWGLLRRHAIVREAHIYGCTPRFRGASQTAERLRELPAWGEAARVLILSESVLEGARRVAVADGKTLVVPDLSRTGSGWILEIDPQQLGCDAADDIAVRLSTGQPAPESLRFRRGSDTAPIDLMVIGAVAVTREGIRVGKGAGEADLVYALGRARGFIGAETPVAVIVHELQVLEEPADREPTDLPIDLIVTPGGTLAVDSLVMRPKGLHPCMITPQRLAAFPGLRAILAREGLCGPECQAPAV